jgi:hypothetical protein
MTNTLHRYGAPQTLENDFIVFAMSARGINDQGSVAKFQRFLEIARKHNPINLGDATKGGVFRPSKSLNPLAHWFRKDERDPEALVARVDQPTVVSAVFDNRDALTGFLKDIRAADLGLSINISSLTDRADELAREAGITRHSVEYSLGFFGALDKLPDRATLSLATMCGHGMISFHFAKKMIDWVKEGRRTPEEASTYMARFCTCGIFNTTRSCAILNDCSHRNRG